VAEQYPDKERPMFDALEELEARDEDPTEAKGKYLRYVGVFFVTLMIFAVIGWAMWRYQ
jgi:hypothetical protein